MTYYDKMTRIVALAADHGWSGCVCGGCASGLTTTSFQRTPDPGVFATAAPVAGTTEFAAPAQGGKADSGQPVSSGQGSVQQYQQGHDAKAYKRAAVTAHGQGYGNCHGYVNGNEGHGQQVCTTSGCTTFNGPGPRGAP